MATPKATLPKSVAQAGKPEKSARPRKNSKTARNPLLCVSLRHLAALGFSAFAVFDELECLGDKVAKQTAVLEFKPTDNSDPTVLVTAEVIIKQLGIEPVEEAE